MPFPADTPFEDGTFKLLLTFDESYPNKPPTVKFLSKMFHPNVYANGELCLDILQNRWSPTYDVAAILTSIQSLLHDPNPNRCVTLWLSPWIPVLTRFYYLVLLMLRPHLFIAKIWKNMSVESSSLSSKVGSMRQRTRTTRTSNSKVHPQARMYAALISYPWLPLFAKQRQKINELKVKCSAKVRRFGAIDMEVVGCMNPKFVACSAYLINFSAAG